MSITEVVTRQRLEEARARAKSFLAEMAKIVISKQCVYETVFLPEIIFNTILSDLSNDNNVVLKVAGQHFVAYGVNVYKTHGHVVLTDSRDAIIRMKVDPVTLEIKSHEFFFLAGSGRSL